jgi:hypothetical protein
MRRSAQKPILSWSHAPATAKTHGARVSPPRADQKGLGQSKRAFSPSRVMMYHPYVGILTLFGDGSIEKDGWPVKRDVTGPRGCPHSNNTAPNVIAPAMCCDLPYTIEICNLLKLRTMASIQPRPQFKISVNNLCLREFVGFKYRDIPCGVCCPDTDSIDIFNKFKG